MGEVYPPPLDSLTSPPAKSSRPSFQTAKPYHLSSQGLPKPCPPTGSLLWSLWAKSGDLVSGLRAFAAGLRCLGTGLQTLKTRLRGFCPQSSKPSPQTSEPSPQASEPRLQSSEPSPQTSKPSPQSAASCQRWRKAPPRPTAEER